MHDADAIARVEHAVGRLALGDPLVVADDEGRENEGDLVVAGNLASADLLGFMIRYTSGLICAPMGGSDLDRLQIRDMVDDNQDPHRTAFTVSVDARGGVSTGISAADRARTIRILADPSTNARDLVRPGHVFPLRARPGGVLDRPGHTEAAVLLASLAGLPPVAAIAELVADDGAVLRGRELEIFAERHGLASVTVPELVRYQRQRISSFAPDVVVQTTRGPFRVASFLAADGLEHVALVRGEVAGGVDVLCRVHSECLTGDVFGSLRCDCGQQLDAAIDKIAAAGRGVVVYVRGHEGRGIGLSDKLRAYRLQDDGADTVDANLMLGLPADVRDYAPAAAILRQLGVLSVRLLTNSPDKHRQLDSYGIKVSGVESVPSVVTDFNRAYLTTKRDRLGHHLCIPDDESELRAFSA